MFYHGEFPDENMTSKPVTVTMEMLESPAQSLMEAKSAKRKVAMQSELQEIKQRKLILSEERAKLASSLEALVPS